MNPLSPSTFNVHLTSIYSKFIYYTPNPRHYYLFQSLLNRLLALAPLSVFHIAPRAIFLKFNFLLKIFCTYFLLEFDMPTYSITPSAHPIKCPHRCPITQSPHPTAHLPFHHLLFISQS